MIFRITKSSSYRDEKTSPPCDSAHWGEYIHVDERTTNDPARIPFRNGETRFTSGVNHRTVNDHIMRDFIHEGWLIEINTLDELVALYKELGEELIISANGDTLQLEIYDDYRG